MIIAEVRDTGMGKWLVLECQHPVRTGKHIVLGGKSHPEMLESCGETFTIGPFTENDKLADKIEEHEQSHLRGRTAPADREAGAHRDDQEHPDMADDLAARRADRETSRRPG